MAKNNFQILYDPALAIGAGLVNGVHQHNIFGAVVGLVADTEKDITSLPVVSIPLPANAGEALEIVSDDPADTAFIQIGALGPDGAAMPLITVQLNGTTAVPLGVLSRINSAASVDLAGFDGDLSIQQAGGGTVFALVLEANQQLNQGQRSVASGKTWAVGNLVGTMQKSLGADTDCVLIVKFKGFSQTKWRRAFGFGLQRSGSTSIEFNNKYPDMNDGPADIKVSAIATVTGTDVAVWMSIIAFDKPTVQAE